MAIHPACDVAVHEHVAGVAVTATDSPWIFSSPTVIDPGSIAYMQPAAWFTVNVRPPIVTVPVRAAPALADTFNITVPFPLPLAPDVIDSHGALLIAVHAQPAVVVTATLIPVAPAAGADWLVGVMLIVHAPPLAGPT
jgi:hypothetical protein